MNCTSLPRLKDSCAEHLVEVVDDVGADLFCVCLVPMRAPGRRRIHKSKKAFPASGKLYFERFVLFVRAGIFVVVAVAITLLKGVCKQTMKSLTLLFSLVGLVASASASTDYLYKDDETAGAVIEHTEENDFEASSKPRLVEFYSPVSKMLLLLLELR